MEASKPSFSSFESMHPMERQSMPHFAFPEAFESIPPKGFLLRIPKNNKEKPLLDF
jgi:hypothetical protein